MSSSSTLYNAGLHSSNPQKRKRSPPPSASNLTFASTLTSLLASSSTKPKSQSPAPRPTKPSKDSIFSVKTKTTKPRKISDGHTKQSHSTTSENVDAATLQRSKRKMEEKARLYASMKRGDYVPRQGGRDKEAEGLIDFDRKWADEQEDPHAHDTSSDDYADSDEEERQTNAKFEAKGEELVEYEDEFGRLRKGTKSHVDKLERRKNAAIYASTELEDMAARPAPPRPDDLIIGNTVQSGAYNPDDTIAAQMARLAEKRERSLTPPEEVHYDASKEIRSKGVGFYQFSRDEEERKKQMEGLGKERGETEKVREEREQTVLEQREKREKEKEERRRRIEKMREEKEAERFLEELGGEVGRVAEGGGEKIMDQGGGQEGGA